MNDDGTDIIGQGPEGRKAARGDAYQVLARKYRPQTFSELIGQDAMVRTLTNAIAADRLAHAWLLAGVRGVGKTTTARIIARALNCVGAGGDGGPTPTPCGECEHCVAIADGRHTDVLEMDAASRTGVDDIRELIEGVRYRPTTARYKVYIIDEVHMLSTNAFNALLKTLEEPPEHVKFVFATTEARKVPMTVLSRCQRFDLHRVEEDELARHFAAIAESEGERVEEGALKIIARAADGSVRDGLSILDQALAGDHGGAVAEDAVRAMLGLADRSQVFELFEAAMGGDIALALERLAAQHESGADAESVVGDLLEVTHWLTRVKVTPEVADDPVVPETERVTGRRLAEGLSMAALTRAWQMLLKGLAEVQAAPQPGKALEMLMVRIAYGASLPTPADLVARLEKDGAGTAVTEAPSTARPDGAEAVAPAQARAEVRGGARRRDGSPGGSAQAAAASPQAEPESAPEAVPALEATAELPQTFEALVGLLQDAREGRLAAELRTHVHLVRYAPGRIEFRPDPGAESTLASRLGAALLKLTGVRWGVTLSSEAGADTLAQQEASEAEARRRDAAGHPLVKAAMEAFPGARITEVRDNTAAGESVPDPDDDSQETEE